MNKGIGIAGFGRTGKSILSFLNEQKFSEPVFIYDDNRDKDINISEFTGLSDIRILRGEDEFGRLSSLEKLIISPGVNGKAIRFEKLRSSGVKIISEVEFASGFISNPIIAVTGSNGKSTTVSLIHHFLVNSNIDSVLCGNIGTPFISILPGLEKETVIVLEASSFQLEEIVSFKPFIALILNITPDHLDRYADLEEYRDAKLNILKNMNREGHVVMNFDDPWLHNTYYSNRQKGSMDLLWFKLTCDNSVADACFRDGMIILKKAGMEGQIDLKDNPLIGNHNVENIMAASLAARLLGAATDSISKSLKSFSGLPHRVEKCGSIGDVKFVNDSKATNIDSTLKAVSGIDGDIVLILGGKDKGGDFRALLKFIGNKVKRVFLIGEAAGLIEEQLREKRDFLQKIGSMSEGISDGYSELKRIRGTVLLSPGCASYDMYNNFEERGDDFRSSVKEFINRNG